MTFIFFDREDHQVLVGNRDKDKRALMGEAARQLADKVYVTDDNPRYEEPAAIRQEILSQLNGHGVDIADRGDAIRLAVKELGQDDILVIAGKGHEQGQIIKDVVRDFDDVTVAKEAWSDVHAG